MSVLPSFVQRIQNPKELERNHAQRADEAGKHQAQRGADGLHGVRSLYRFAILCALSSLRGDSHFRFT